MEWPELLHRHAEALRQHLVWLDNGCVGAPPQPADPAGVRGPVPPEFRARAAELAAETARVQLLISDRLATLRPKGGHVAPIRGHYEDRPVPRYLDALG